MKTDKKIAIDLLEALEELIHLHLCEQEGMQSGQPTTEQWYNAVKKGETALENAKNEH